MSYMGIRSSNVVRRNEMARIISLISKKARDTAYIWGIIRVDVPGLDGIF